MRVTIIRDDSVVGVDGIFRRVDLSALPERIRAMQWNGGGGHIEYDQGANTALHDIAAFQPFVELWKAAAAQPSDPPSARQMRAAASVEYPLQPRFLRDLHIDSARTSSEILTA